MKKQLITIPNTTDSKRRMVRIENHGTANISIMDISSSDENKELIVAPDEYVAFELYDYFPTLKCISLNDEEPKISVFRADY